MLIVVANTVGGGVPMPISQRLLEHTILMEEGEEEECRISV